jgi:hypothetical protein
MRRVLVASAGSIAFHGSVVAVAVLVAALKREAPVAAIAAPVNAVDVWSGVTAAIGGERLVDVNVDALGGQVGPAGAAGRAADATPPAAPPPPPKATIPAVIAPKPAAEKPALPDDPTAEGPPPKPRAKKPKPAAASSAVDEPGEQNEPPAPPASPRATKHKAGGAGGENGDGARSGPFGAEGPSAVRSLGRAFARSIAAACQSDAGWAKLPVGDAGAIEVAITVDEGGRITGSRALDPGHDPPKQLLALVKRTIALIDSGTFELKGSLGAGSEVLRIQATLSDVAADVAGGATALSFGEGKAAFTQESGRHVEVTVKVVKVETAAAP